MLDVLKSLDEAVGGSVVGKTSFFKFVDEGRWPSNRMHKGKWRRKKRGLTSDNLPGPQVPLSGGCRFRRG